MPPCPDCGGVLKPDVVFFGENVPKDRVERAVQRLERADAMLIVGSSLMVLSGYRFARMAAAAGKPIAAVNLGRTRADDLLTLKVRAPCEAALAFLLEGAADSVPDGRERHAAPAAMRVAHGTWRFLGQPAQPAREDS